MISDIQESIPEKGYEKRDRIDFGIAILHRRAKPGERFTHADIAIFAGCTPQAIQAIERKALSNVLKLIQKTLTDDDVRALSESNPRAKKRNYRTFY